MSKNDKWDGLMSREEFLKSVIADLEQRIEELENDLRNNIGWNKSEFFDPEFGEACGVPEYDGLTKEQKEDVFDDVLLHMDYSEWYRELGYCVRSAVEALAKGEGI